MSGPSGPGEGPGDHDSPLADVDRDDRKLILGLGNPGTSYEETRHNLGARVVEVLARRWGVELDREECRSLFASAELADLAMPLTYMNRSGYAARCLVERRHYRPGSVLVVFDDVNLPLGRLRMRASGSPGGHRGMESIIENLRTTEIPRLRLGIAPLEEDSEALGDMAEFVLAPFAPEERERVKEETELAAAACESWVEHGAEITMNRFNG